MYISLICYHLDHCSSRPSRIYCSKRSIYCSKRPFSLKVDHRASIILILHRMMGRRRCPCKKGMSLVAVSSLSVGDVRYCYVRMSYTVGRFVSSALVSCQPPRWQDLLDLQDSHDRRWPPLTLGLEASLTFGQRIFD